MLNPCTERMYITMSCMIKFHNNDNHLSYDAEPVLDRTRKTIMKQTARMTNRIQSLREDQESFTLDILYTVEAGERTDQEPIQREGKRFK